jgi:serine protease inhibitor
MRRLVFFLFLSTLSCLKADESPASSLNQAGMLAYYIIDKSSNTILSPLAINISLMMCYEGARGNTAKQIENALHLSMNPSEMGKAYQELLSKLGNGIKLGSSLWVDQSTSILPTFSQVISEDFEGSIQKVNFKQSSQAAATMNNWMHDYSGGKISNFVDPSTLSGGTKMVLLNALVLQGAWQNPFPTQRTGMQEFQTAQGQHVNCSMMNQVSNLYYFENEETQIASLPLADPHSNISFIVFLPRKKNIDPYNFYYSQDESKPEGFLSYLNMLENRMVNLTLPKFIIGQKLNLKTLFHSLGITDALGTEGDFSGIDGTKNLFISQAMHESILSIDEGGIYAVAASGITFSLKSSKGPEAITMNANHPFLYAVYDFDADVLLFLGECQNPVAAPEARS